MTLREVYQLFIDAGIKADPRGVKRVKEYLRSRKRDYAKLKGIARRFFDKETLTNPYSDTRILYGDPDKQVKRILVGIDIDAGELLLADRMAQKGEGFDLVLSHHPKGVAQIGLDEVLNLHTDLLTDMGVVSDVVKKLIQGQIRGVSRSSVAMNQDRAVDTARLLNMPFMCCHTPSDNNVVQYLQRLVDRKKPRTLKHVIDLLMKEPEYRYAASRKVMPQVLSGKESDKAGRIFVDMTGGMQGPNRIYGRLSQLGVQTVLGMYYGAGHYQSMSAENVFAIAAGHMASDSMGMNLILDQLVKKSKTKIEIVGCSGFKRVKR